MKDAALSHRARSLVKRLRTRKSREREGLVLVEGPLAVDAALGAGVEARFALVSPRLESAPRGAALAVRLREAGVDVRRVDEETLADLADTETPQGVLLVAVEASAGIEAVVAGGRYLVLDGVQDPGNAGTLLRAAVAFGLDGVVSLDGTVDLFGPKAVRASAGLVFSIPVIRAAAGAIVAQCEEVGVPLIVADAAGVALDTYRGGGSYALVVGNEGWGIRPEVREAAAAVVSVPMPGPAESLNVATAAAVLLYALSLETARG